MRLVFFACAGIILGLSVYRGPGSAEEHGIVTAGPRACPAVALTYDLCPVRGKPGFDAELINLLTSRRIPATFFVSGKWITRHDADVKQLLAVPYFEVGTHGNVHAHLPLHDAAYQTREISGPITLLKSGYGREARLFRPPYGEFDDATVDVVKSLGLQFILWTIKSGDPDPALSAESILTRINRQVKPGSIIVMHANGKGRHTREITEELITTVLPRKGLKPVTVTDLLSCNPPNE
jgi:peptidoglycan/xylan/chitin deacetylase (PgdA/CDA1 family)